jgi:hypothetical protein
MPKSSGTSRATAEGLLPDLWAKGMNITADYGTGTVYVTGVCENLGPGPVSGPFLNSLSVTIEYNDDSEGGLRVTESYSQNFAVPSTVTLWGGPSVFAPLVRRQDGKKASVLPPPSAGAFQSTIVSGPLPLPLMFYDSDANAVYTLAQFWVDSNYQTDDYNRANNQYFWPGDFQFLSSAARAQKAPVVVKRTREGSIA